MAYNWGTVNSISSPTHIWIGNEVLGLLGYAEHLLMLVEEGERIAWRNISGFYVLPL